MRQTAEAIEQFRKDRDQYPNSLRGLVANDGTPGWHGPYLNRDPIDPWGRPFLYFRSDESSSPEIVSHGADGKPGGFYFDSDLSSRDPGRMVPETPHEKRALWTFVGIWLGARISLVGCIVVLTIPLDRLLPRSE